LPIVTISRRSVLALLGVPVIAGCSAPVDFTPAEHRSPTPTTGSVPPEIEVESSFFGRSTDGRHIAVPDASPSGLVFSTPHLDGRIGEIYIGPTLPHDVAAKLERMNPLRAPQGYTFVAFTAQAGMPAFPEEAEHPVSATMNLDGTAMPLRNLFGGYSRGGYGVGWEFIVGCIPEGGTAMLEVTDEDKTIKIDLVRGVPAIDDAWASNAGFRDRRVVGFDPPEALFEREFTTSPPSGIEAQTGLFQIGFTPGNAFLAPWNPVHGWAQPGRMWLTIPMNARVAFQEVPAIIELDLPGSFTYRGASGEAMPLVAPTTVSTEEVRRQRADVIPTFDVTGQDATATLTFNANGKAVVNYTEIQGVPANFSSGADPLRFNLVFADAPERFG
jgi:hypothetical protein